MVDLVKNFNFAIFMLFTLLYSYQLFYIGVVLFKKDKKHQAKKLHKFAVISSGRNESAVIGSLIDSIKAQNYPIDLVDIFVVADNCTDDTADVARAHGAYVYERNDLSHIGKGYALDYVFQKIAKDHWDKNYEGYFVFDADNLLDKNYIREMNNVFDMGYRAVTSYRNSKNYSTNWITAGYGLWFLREAKYLNNARMLLNTSCAISGTGFLLGKEIVEANGGWKFNLLTEDIQFSIANVIKGECIGYCSDAVFYDEQPYTFKQSWNQRLRWSKGFYQVFGKYGKELFKNMFNRFSCFDMLMTIMPALFITLFTILFNVGFMVYGLLAKNAPNELVNVAIKAFIASFGNYYLMLFIVGFITMITEWKNIYCQPLRKIWSAFTFPLFMFTYIPIAVVALFKKVEWKPIKHDVNVSIDEIKKK